MYVPWDSENEDKQIKYPPTDFFHQLIREVHPLHPLWAKNPEAATLMLTLSRYDPEILNYTRQMVRQHPDDLVVRNLVIKIIEEQAGQYKDAREMPEYQWVIERYGENNLARKAILAFREAKKDG